MKNSLKRLLTATAVGVTLLCVQATSSLCRAQSLPDLKDRMIKALAAREKPRLSPDLAAVHIDFEDGYVVGVFKNAGDRDYHPLDRDTKDSFMRRTRLQRVVQTSTQTYTQEIGTSIMGDAPVGKVFRSAFKRPKNDPAATKYTWILTIEGDDPNMQNNSFKLVQSVTKLD